MPRLEFLEGLLRLKKSVLSQTENTTESGFRLGGTDQETSISPALVPNYEDEIDMGTSTRKNVGDVAAIRRNRF